MIRAQRYHDISCGHRVVGHEGKCAHLHGHNYRIWFTCEAAEVDAIGRVIDFGVIKERLCMWVEWRWDHRLLLWEQDPLYPLLHDLDEAVVAVPFNPTAENIAKYLVEERGPVAMHDTGVRLVAVTVEETSKCQATFSLL